MTGGTEGAGRPVARGGAGRNPAAAVTWITWTALLLAAAILLWRGWVSAGTYPGMSRFFWGLALAALLPRVPLRALAGWRCRRAARRLAETWRTGRAALPGWPGVREVSGALTMRCGSGSFRFWALALGLVASGVLLWRLGRAGGPVTAFDAAVSLSPALCAVLLSVLWGPAGWMLSVDPASSRAGLMLWRAMRRTLSSAVSLPTIQGVELVVAKRRGALPTGILVRRAKGGDWKLGVPGYWPPELIEALAARIAGLAGVEFGPAPAPGAAPAAAAPVPAPAPSAAPPESPGPGGPPATGGPAG